MSLSTCNWMIFEELNFQVNYATIVESWLLSWQYINVHVCVCIAVLFSTVMMLSLTLLHYITLLNIASSVSLTHLAHLVILAGRTLFFSFTLVDSKLLCQNWLFTALEWFLQLGILMKTVYAEILKQMYLLSNMSTENF